jgi:hypothetical protein
LAALAAERAPDARVQQTHVIVNFGGRADRRARIPDAVLLTDRDCRADSLDAVDVRLLHPLEKLTGIGGQRLDVAPLSFRINRVEGKRRFTRSADTRKDDELAVRQRDVDVLEVVRAGAANDERAARWLSSLGHLQGHCCEFRRNDKRKIVLPRFGGRKRGGVTHHRHDKSPDQSRCGNCAAKVEQPDR